MTGKRTWIIGVMLLGGIVFPAGLAAQAVASGAWRDYDCVVRSDAWLANNNASGLTYLPDSVHKISIAEMFANKSDGKFINYSQSDNSFTFGAQTESFFRMNDKVVLYGKIDYANFTGQNMSGSAFIHPDYNAFDITEISASTKGEKNLEQYGLVGAVGIRLLPRLSLGGKVDYRTANYSKHKDLRHQNKYLDLTVTAGAAYRLTQAIEIGANYLYRRSIESLKFGIYGNTDQMYSPFISFGAFYGRTELFSSSGSGYTYGTASKPMFNAFNGASLQVNLKIGQTGTFFNEFSYLLRNGYYGEHSSSNVTYTEHDGTIKSYSGTWAFVQKQNEHFLNVNLCNDQLTNGETIYTKENTPGGKTEIVYHGTTTVSDKTVSTAGMEYLGQFNVKDYCPEWILKAGTHLVNRQQTIFLYPYFRKQDINYWDVYLSADKRITIRKNQYGVSLGALYGSGGGEAYKDGLYTTPSDDSHRPASADYNLFREHEYLTANHVKGSLGLYYSRVLSPYIKGYARLEYELTNAFQVKRLEGNQFNAINLSLGCNF
jgi:hypothetical protein